MISISFSVIPQGDLQLLYTVSINCVFYESLVCDLIFCPEAPYTSTPRNPKKKKCKPDLLSVQFLTALFFLSNQLHLSCFSFSELVMYYYLLEFGEEQIKGWRVVGKLMKWISSITGIQEPGGS